MTLFLAALTGLVLLALGGSLIYYEVSHPPTHDMHVYLFVGIALFGALVLSPDLIVRRVRQVVVILLPIIPWSKTPQKTTEEPIPPPEKSP